MARYFQNLNKTGDNFQAVVELDYIDDSDPDFILYYFKDGSKCNKEYIAPINTKDVIGKYEYAEVSDPANVWKFRNVKVNDDTPQYEIGANGERYEIPNLHTFDKNGLPKEKLEVVRTPITARVSVSDETYLLSKRVVEKKAHDFNVFVKTKREELAKSAEVEKSNMPNEEVVNTITRFDVDKLGSTIEFVYNGKLYSMSKDEFFKNAIMKPEEKITEKIVEKEVIVNKVIDDHIEIGIDENQKTLVDNMIDMSQKEECDISMDITLTLPPVSVYQLIKSVYPSGMAKGFVNIIADRMQIKELKSAVAEGLLVYYDGDTDVEVTDTTNELVVTPDVIEEETTDEPKRKAGRPKKA